MGKVGEFIVDIGSLMEAKASISADYVRLSGIVDGIEKQINAASGLWKSEFSSTVQKNAAKLISDVRKEQKTLSDNLQKHLDLVWAVSTAAEGSVKSNADLFE